MNILKMEHHLKTLKEKHDLLDKEIKEEYSHHVDEVLLKEKKLKKLKLKEEMEEIKKKIA
jgi:hypothetical protein